MSTNGMSSGHNQHKASDSYNTTEQQSSNASPTQEPTKDEVGWFFVQQYYTTLSKSPEKLHLFYTKDSQFVYGEEAQVSNVSVGRSAIEERIRQLGFQDCKVRVNNVDSLSSFDNIVIQVIGETSNKQEPPRRFVQTFVLAKQTSGYFVLNDIWRFIIDDEEEELVPEQTATEAIAPDAEEKAVETTEPEMDEEKALEPQAEVASEPIVEPVAEPITEPAVEEEEEEEEIAQNSEAVAEPEEDVEEKPSQPEAPQKDEAKAPESKPEESKPVAIPATKEETPAPVKPPAPTKAPEPVARPIPVVPMTWAGRAAAAAAAAAGPKAAAAGPKAAAPPAKTPAASSVAANKASAASQATATPTAADASSSSEWQTAGSDSKRQNRPQSMVGGSHEKETVNAYVKSVSDKINEADLKNTFSVFGQVVYCDINRAKNCAFVDFANMEGYKAAFTANPHIINGETIMVEARKPKTGAYGNYPGSNFNGRGGMGRGRGNFNDRGGYAPRGNFGRGRGGGAPRGRGPQISNA